MTDTLGLRVFKYTIVGHTTESLQQKRKKNLCKVKSYDLLSKFHKEQLMYNVHQPLYSRIRRVVILLVQITL